MLKEDLSIDTTFNPHLFSSDSTFKSISERLSAKPWQFPSLFSEGPRFCNNYLKLKEHLKILKTIGGSS
jgi:hypothetical protein